MVSVIIPNYNHAPFLKQRIESVLNQSLQDFELVILDDCSTDNSREIIEGYRGHPKIKHIIYNDTNSGSTFKQWEKGINLSQGEHIWIAESDDFCTPDFLEKLLFHVKWKEDTALAFCNSNIWENDLIIGNSKNWSAVYRENELLNESGIYEGKVFCEKYLINHCIISNVSSVLFKSSVIKEYQFNGLSFCEDWLLYLTVLQNNTFIYVKDSLNFFRKHDQTVRVQKINSLHNESLFVLEKSAELFKKNHLSLKQLKISYSMWYFKDAWWTGKYHVNFVKIFTYLKRTEMVNLPSLFKILYRSIRLKNA